jgi:TetR/AcrR family transcriptional regulator, transcriptional repressor for nem operon
MSGIIHGMGHSREDKARSHQRIVEIAARRFRESGTAGPGVAELMQEAGLTHGGFYKHFGSRDDLVAEAVQRALVENDGVLTELLAGADDPLVAFVDWVCGGGPRRGRAAFGPACAGRLHRTGAALPHAAGGPAR